MRVKYIKGFLTAGINKLAAIGGQVSLDEPLDDSELLSGSIFTASSGEYALCLYSESRYCQTFIGEPVSGDFNGELFPIVIKRIKASCGGDKAIQERFKQEMSIVRDFLHPQLPRYVAHGKLEGQYYYSYRYIEGVPLKQVIEKKNLYPPELVAEVAPGIVIQLLQQLYYMHEHMGCVVHGNIGLRSILLSQRHSVGLLEFGSAYRKDRVIDDDYRWLADARYYSPEQARGEAWDERSDIYQVGVVFYELLTGNAWNKQGKQEEEIAFAANLNPVEKNFLEGVVSPALSCSIALMLHPDQSERIQTVAECLDAL
ncbi:MAG: protein kinase [Gammaproteobacteria bacterium]|nr:protein kinase [Gammaproteobacteria bacterium]